MSKYTQEQQDALESIKEAGVQLDVKLFTKAPDPNKPWENTSTTEDAKLWLVIFPVDNAPSKLKETYLTPGSMIKNEHRYILAAGEGRTKHPKTGDVVKNVEGQDATVLGCAPLTVDGAGAIIYEMVVKL